MPKTKSAAPPAPTKHTVPCDNSGVRRGGGGCPPPLWGRVPARASPRGIDEVVIARLFCLYSACSNGEPWFRPKVRGRDVTGRQHDKVMIVSMITIIMDLARWEGLQLLPLLEPDVCLLLKVGDQKIVCVAITVCNAGT